MKGVGYRQILASINYYDIETKFMIEISYGIPNSLVGAPHGHHKGLVWTLKQLGAD